MVIDLLLGLVTFTNGNPNPSAENFSLGIAYQVAALPREKYEAGNYQPNVVSVDGSSNSKCIQAKAKEVDSTKVPDFATIQRGSLNPSSMVDAMLLRTGEVIKLSGAFGSGISLADIQPYL